jgi:FkbM family methyltransferase
MTVTSSMSTRLVGAASRALSFASAFGILKGLWLYIRIAIKRHGNRPFLISIPGISHSVWLRPSPSDIYTFFQVFIEDQFEVASFKQGQRLTDAINKEKIGNTPLIIDCGAHIGLGSIWFATRFPRSVIYSIEPDPDNFRALVKNTTKYPNITPINAAIWDTHARLHLTNIDAPGWARQVEPYESKLAIDATRAVTIDEIIQQADEDRATIVKVDIEGGEASLFRSNTSWLDRTDLLIIELHDWKFPGQRSSLPLLRRISEGNFEVTQKGENFFCFNVSPVQDGA